MLDEEIVNVEAAQLVYDLRKKAGPSQRELAKRVGTTASAICRVPIKVRTARKIAKAG